MRVLAIALLAGTVGQPINGYSGEWTADYHGTTYVRLVLGGEVGAPQGAMSIGESIHIDAQGDVDAVAEASSTLARMFDVRWNGAVLSFSVKAGDDVHRFELRLIDANTGDLTPIIPEEQRQELAKDGIPLPKPFRVTKAR
jgi:hypothetical protein